MHLLGFWPGRPWRSWTPVPMFAVMAMALTYGCEGGAAVRWITVRNEVIPAN